MRRDKSNLGIPDRRRSRLGIAVGLVDVFHARMVARVRKLIALKPFVRPAARFSRCVNHVNHSVQESVGEKDDLLARFSDGGSRKAGTDSAWSYSSKGLLTEDSEDNEMT